jgi:penicillin-binding protein 2
MYKRKFNNRFIVMILFLILFFLVITFRLASLMIAEGETHREYTENRIVKSISISAPRGEIRDRYGRLLAGSRPSFAVEISKNELPDEQINEISEQLIHILEKNNDPYIDEFPIIFLDDRYQYTFDREIEKWKTDYEIPQWYNAKEAFDLIRIRYEIEETDPADVQQKLLQIPELNMPISIRTWKFTEEMKKDEWLQKFYIPEEHHRAADAYRWLKETRFKIPEETVDEKARKIMAVREQIETQLPGFMQYQPVKIAQDISQRSVTMIEENIFELPGVSVVVEPVRIYPEKMSAAHILGNLGKISQPFEIDHYINEMGYLPSDIIGKTGIEHRYEANLKGRDGSQRVVVDSKGRLVRVLEKNEPIPGDTVFLSIDIEFQKKVEQILEDVLKTIQVGGIYETNWGSNRLVGTQGPRKNANAGAVVVTDVKTGELLAMASYPAYDPNLFVTGISGENWNSLMPDNPRDPLAPRPLMNIAMSTAVQPGSTYKMLVGLAGLEQGLSADYRMVDRGYIQVGDHQFGNWLWNQSRQTMGNQNLYEAIAHSNNYYFYSVASGYDYSRNRSLPIDMDVDTLVEYAHLFGLNDPAGIEITIPRERYGGVPDPASKEKTVKAMLRNHLNRILSFEDLDDEKVELNDETISSVIEALIAMADENPPRYVVHQNILSMGIRESRANFITDLVKYSYYNQTQWTLADTMNFAIGQGGHAYTPLQMANYMATVANGGIRNQVSVTRLIMSHDPDKNVDQPERHSEILTLKNPANLDHIKRGMYDATVTGGARSYFTNFPVRLAAKTGTAQREGKIPPADEVIYLLSHLRAFNLNETEVLAETERMMLENQDNHLFQDQGYAMREAIKSLRPSIRNSDLDQFKDDYDNFSWFTGFAPYEDPQIAIAVLIFQGGSGGYGAPVFREVAAEYLGLNRQNTNKTDLFNSFQTE